MNEPRYRLTEAAASDIEGILIYTGREFGPKQRDRYQTLIEKAASLVAAKPNRAGSRPREELSPGLRSFHLDRAAGRRGGAHVLYYVTGILPDGRAGVTIVRVLHEAMEPARYIAQAGPR